MSTHPHDLLRRADEERDPLRAVALYQEVLALPDPDEDVDRAEVEELIADRFAETGSFGAAAAAMERSIQLGRAGEPDPRSRLAEFALRAGRLDEGLARYEELGVEQPGDVWLCNAAGLDLLDAGLLDPALAWLERGLQIALETGDPHALTRQLLEARHRARVRQGADDPRDERGLPLPDEELSERAVSLVHEQVMEPVPVRPLGFDLQDGPEQFEELVNGISSLGGTLGNEAVALQLEHLGGTRDRPVDQQARALVAAGEHWTYAEDPDRALECFERAVATGGHAEPGTRCYLAGHLLVAGRPGEAADLFRRERSLHPSPALFVFAGEAYEVSGDLRQAAAWYTAGYTRFEHAGSAQDLLWLLGSRRRARAALGEPPDELDLAAEEAVSSLSDDVVLQVFLTRAEWRAWERTWPGSLAPWSSFEQQRAAIEEQLRHGGEDRDVLLVPLTVHGLQEHAAPLGLDPTAEQTRLDCGRSLADEGVGVTWPPAKNAACWCGSGSKYKRCCGR